MKKAPTPLELELAAEAELARLQRQYRNMESERNAFFTGALPGSKARVIEVLKEERNDLDLTLGVAKSAQNQRKDERVSAHLTELLDRYDKYDDDIRRGRIEIVELEDQIKIVQRQIIAMSKYQVTDAQYQKKIDNTAIAVTKFENQLDTEIKKFNNVMADNQRLRGEIEHMLMQRARFNKLWNHLIFNLTKGKQIMIDLIEQSTMAYDQREELCQKLEALKRRGAMDLALHTQEMQLLQRKLNNDSKLQKYLGVKGQRRVMLDLQEREHAKNKAEREAKENQLQQYKELLERITDFCGETDVERLAIQFKKQEADNFSLFTYVTELNRDVGQLTDKIITLKSNVDAERQSTAWRKEHETQRLVDLQTVLDEVTAKADKEEKRMSDCQESLDSLLKGVEELFKMIEADDTPITSLLGDAYRVTLNNVMHYLEIIETRTIEIMQMVYFIENEGDKSPEFALLKAATVSETSTPITEREGESEEEGTSEDREDGEATLTASREEMEVIEGSAAAAAAADADEPDQNAADETAGGAEDETAEDAEDAEGAEGEAAAAAAAEVDDVADVERELDYTNLDKDSSSIELDVRKSSKKQKAKAPPKIIRDTVRPPVKAEPVDKIMYTQPCPLCVEAEEIDFSRMEEEVQPYTRAEVKEKLKERMLLPDIGNRLHNVSYCKLPGSRKILQRRFLQN